MRRGKMAAQSGHTPIQCRGPGPYGRAFKLNRRSPMSVIEAEAPVSRNKHERFRDLMEKAKTLPPLKVAVAHPCDQASLGAVIEAAERGLIDPILVGPEARIKEVAQKHGLD